MEMASFQQITIKKEDPDGEYISIESNIKVEDDIKIEETCLQTSTDEPPALESVIIEEKLSICSMCKCGFQRNITVKMWNESDLYKCNKCILHSRLNHVFATKTLKTRKRGGGGFSNKKKKRKCKSTNLVENEDSSRDSDVIVDSSGEKSTDSIVITKVMFVCSSCKSAFERKDTTGVKDSSDWAKCNKCILHSRLNSVFKPKKNSI